MIAPGYTDEAMELLMQKKKGNYNIIQIDPSYVPADQLNVSRYMALPLNREEMNLQLMMNCSQIL